LDVDELEDQRATGADAAASGEKVSANDVFEDGGFAGRLGPDDDLRRELLDLDERGQGREETETHNLREIKRVIADGVEDQVLQLVDGAEQVLAEGCHGDGSLTR
jgi:hypothetical protein